MVERPRLQDGSEAGGETGSLSVAEDGDLLRVTSEVSDVELDPLECGDEVT